MHEVAAAGLELVPHFHLKFVQKELHLLAFVSVQVQSLRVH